jgi:tyrosinase
MGTAPELRVRESITVLQDAYTGGDKRPLENLWRAWRGIQALPADDPQSFFTLASYHGAPFRGAGWGNADYWGGYCNHGNILFPTWHRIYLLKLEEALRSVPGCASVTLPFWDETSPESLANGIPWALTRRNVKLDGETIPNPLRSFVLNRRIKDHVSGNGADYSKPIGYETVRYPLSGLVGTDADRAASKKHNARYKKDAEAVLLLNQNVVNWLRWPVIDSGVVTKAGQVANKYRACLHAPNYTVFSNTTSAAQWNDDHALDGKRSEVSLESPHNSIHLAVGGFDVPGQGDSSPISGANGDMGENDTAAFDPIFYLHHCFIDRLFWLWQIKNKSTDHLEVLEEYPGTNSVDSQGPTPGVVPNSWLTLDSPLNPFIMTVGGESRPYASVDCVNIEKQLGYTYGPGSLQDAAARRRATAPARVVSVSGINRTPIRGSFVVSVFANVGGQRVPVGTEAVLSRWNVSGCANCQTHLETKTFVDVSAAEPRLRAAAAEASLADADSYEVDLTTHVATHRIAGGAARAAARVAQESAEDIGQQFVRIEVR